MVWILDAILYVELIYSTYFMLLVSLYPLEIENQRFSGDMERNQWHEMGDSPELGQIWIEDLKSLGSETWKFT